MYHDTKFYIDRSRDFDEICLNNPSSGSPYGDYGWWQQNNGHTCLENNSSKFQLHCNYMNDAGKVSYLRNNNICNWIRGTDGQQFHPYVTSDDTLWIFQKDICRSVFLKFKVSWSQFTNTDNLQHFKHTRSC